MGKQTLNLNRSLESLADFVRLPTSALLLHLDVARYAFDETPAHLLNNRTKSAKDSNDRFRFNVCFPIISIFHSKGVIRL